MSTTEATLTIRAGKDTLRTRGSYEFTVTDRGQHRLHLLVASDVASARFFAANYGKSISVELDMAQSRP